MVPAWQCQGWLLAATGRAVAPSPPRWRNSWRSLSTAGRSLAAVCAVAAGLAAAAPAAAQQDGPATPAYSDVASGVHKPAIDALAKLGLFENTLCGGGAFCPDEAIKRSTMAVWLVRAVDGAEPPAADTSRFTDVDKSNWQAAHFERLAELGITQGCATDPLQYCPNQPVTRAQMATFLVPEGTFTSIAASSSNACAIGADGTITCWGDATDRWGQATTGQLMSDIPEGTFTSIAVGERYGCAVRSDRRLTCWGNPEWGGLFYRGSYLEPTPGRVPSGTFEAVTVGYAHACAIRTDSTVTCWGADAHGWLDAPQGSFTAIDTTPPIRTEGDDIAGYTAAVSSNGTISFWGSTILYDDCCG